MSDFFRTQMGQKFYSSDIPALVKAARKVPELVEELKRMNDLKERELDEKSKS